MEEKTYALTEEGVSTLKNLLSRMDDLENEIHELRIAVRARDTILETMLRKSVIMEQAKEVLRHYEGAIKNLADK